VFGIISLYLTLAVSPADQTPEELVHEPYVELLNQSVNSDRDALRALRSAIARERDEKIEATKHLEKQWKEKLEAARRELKTLSEPASKRRTQLHLDIAALERAIQDKTREREQGIPSIYDAQLAKVWLLEHWPDRRAEILRRIDEGRAGTRRHGDVEDIGYRKLVEDPEKDIEIGEQAARQMVAGGWLPLELQDNNVQRYIRQLAGKIAFSSDLKVPLHVTVLEGTQPRVIALPGGFLYVTTGVLRTARTESELAGVLSREIARIAAKHATRASKKSVISKMFMPVAQIASGLFSGGINPGAYYGIGYGMQGLSGLMNRVLNDSSADYQKEADQLGTQYAWKAGYDPRGFIGFLDSLSGSGKTDLVGKERPLPQRLLNLFSEIEYLRPLGRPVIESAEFDQARRRVVEGSGS
jgi:hypothetical protein